MSTGTRRILTGAGIGTAAGGVLGGVSGWNQRKPGERNPSTQTKLHRAWQRAQGWGIAGGITGASLGNVYHEHERLRASYKKTHEERQKRRDDYRKREEEFDKRWRESQSGRDWQRRKQENDDWFNRQRREHGGSDSRHNWGGAQSSAEDMREHFGHLGLSGNEKTKAEVRKAHRAAAMRHHPDRGGNPEKMKKVNTAWESVQNSGWFHKLASDFTSGFLGVTR